MKIFSRDEVYAALKNKIESGYYPVGSKLPSQKKIMLGIWHFGYPCPLCARSPGKGRADRKNTGPRPDRQKARLRPKRRIDLPSPRNSCGYSLDPGIFLHAARRLRSGLMPGRGLATADSDYRPYRFR